jgi:hypothetical protein
MLRTVSSFYLASMLLAFDAALWLGANDVHPSLIFVYAMMAWPVTALMMLVKKKLAAIRG